MLELGGSFAGRVLVQHEILDSVCSTEELDTGVHARNLSTWGVIVLLKMTLKSILTRKAALFFAMLGPHPPVSCSPSLMDLQPSEEQLHTHSALPGYVSRWGWT